MCQHSKMSSWQNVGRAEGGREGWAEERRTGTWFGRGLFACRACSLGIEKGFDFLVEDIDLLNQ